VVELRVPFNRLDRGCARLRVPGGIELESETPPEEAVALRTEVGPRLDEGEIDVEEDCSKRHHRSEL
jgi:xanthine/CO dehydrogenase XdhC/CoxF family maturation factor